LLIAGARDALKAGGLNEQTQLTGGDSYQQIVCRTWSC
jgi:hypothetical protein